MDRAARNKDLVAGLGNNLFFADAYFQTPLGNGDQFVGGVDEIDPLPARRIDEQVTEIAPHPPVGGDCGGIDGTGKFFLINNSVIARFSPKAVLDARSVPLPCTAAWRCLYQL
jgi:hypothetical protein